jgi:hypothetical protein
MSALTATRAADIIAGWPDESREAAQLVLDAHGEPDEASPSELRWHRAWPWKRIVAQRVAWEHRFPVQPGTQPDPDERVLSDDDLERAREEGARGS